MVVAIAVYRTTVGCVGVNALKVVARSDLTCVGRAIVRRQAATGTWNRGVLTHSKDEEAEADILSACVAIVTFGVLRAAEYVDVELARVVVAHVICAEFPVVAVVISHTAAELKVVATYPACA